VGGVAAGCGYLGLHYLHPILNIRRRWPKKYVETTTLTTSTTPTTTQHRFRDSRWLAFLPRDSRGIFWSHAVPGGIAGVAAMIACGAYRNEDR